MIDQTIIVKKKKRGFVEEFDPEKIHRAIRKSADRILVSLNDEECKYISHYSTHLDFLIVNHVTKKPVLAIETDGHNFHHEETDQHQRDERKNHILDVYGLPLLRLSTTGSGEKDKIMKALKDIMC